jgi:hypothetical protein
MEHEAFIENGYLPPWSVEFNENVLVFLDFIVEVIVSENENSIIGFNTRYEIDCKKCN